MKAAVFYGPFDIKTEQVEKPKLRDNRVLLKVKACGVCGSDMHMYKLNLYTDILCWKLDKGGGIPGHEFSGEIVEVGSQVRDYSVGDRIAAMYFGGMAEYAPVPALPGRTAVKLPPEVSYEEGATLEPLANSLHAAVKGKPAEGENVVVFGAGIIGLGVVQCLRALEVDLNKLIVVDVSDLRLDVAQRVGADVVINAAVEDPYEKVVELVGTAPLMYQRRKVAPLVDVVYDCVGYIKDRPEPLVIQKAMDMVRDSTGRIVVHGLFEEKVTIDFEPMVAKQVDILGSFGFVPAELEQSLELMRTQKVDRHALISHEFGLEQAKEAFETQGRVEESVKVLIKP